MDEPIEREFEVVEIDGRPFIIVCNSSDVFEGKGRQVKFPEDEDLQVALIRKNGKLFALHNICPHRHQDQIYNGIIRNMNIMCPVHGWTYSLETGRNVNRRQGLKSLRRYDVFEKDGIVYLEKPEFEIPKWRQ